VGATGPGNHLRWLPGVKIEFSYRERTMGVEFGVGGWRPMGVMAGGSRGGCGSSPTGAAADWRRGG